MSNFLTCHWTKWQSITSSNTIFRSQEPCQRQIILWYQYDTSPYVSSPYNTSPYGTFPLLYVPYISSLWCWVRFVTDKTHCHKNCVRYVPQFDDRANIWSRFFPDISYQMYKLEAVGLTLSSPTYCLPYLTELHRPMGSQAGCPNLTNPWISGPFALTKPNPTYDQSYPIELQQPMGQWAVCPNLT